MKTSIKRGVLCGAGIVIAAGFIIAVFMTKDHEEVVMKEPEPIEKVEKKPEKEPEKEAQKEPEKLDTPKVNANYLATEDRSDTLAAMCYLGYGAEKEENLKKVLQENNLNSEGYEEVIANKDCEWYLILPKYEGTSVKVEEVELNDDGELAVTKELLTTQNPILLCCNISDIVPSTKVTVTYGKEAIEFNPYLSLENGKMAEVDRVYAIQ